MNAFLLVFNGQVPRWTGATLDVLKLLAKNFPRFWDNLIVILNFMPQDTKSIQRRAQSQKDKEKLGEVKKAIQTIYGTTASIPVIALDTNYSKDDPLEIAAFSKAMDTIFVTAKIFPPYDPSPAMAHRPKLE